MPVRCHLGKWMLLTDHLLASTISPPDSLLCHHSFHTVILIMPFFSETSMTPYCLQQHFLSFNDQKAIFTRFPTVIYHLSCFFILDSPSCFTY